MVSYSSRESLCDFTIFFNHKSIMEVLVELDMVDSHVTLGLDWLHAC